MSNSGSFDQQTRSLATPARASTRCGRKLAELVLTALRFYEPAARNDRVSRQTRPSATGVAAGSPQNQQRRLMSLRLLVVFSRQLPAPGRLAVLVQHDHRRVVPSGHVQSLLDRHAERISAPWRARAVRRTSRVSSEGSTTRTVGRATGAEPPCRTSAAHRLGPAASVVRCRTPETAGRGRATQKCRSQVGYRFVPLRARHPCRKLAAGGPRAGPSREAGQRISASAGRVKGKFPPLAEPRQSANCRQIVGCSRAVRPAESPSRVSAPRQDNRANGPILDRHRATTQNRNVSRFFLRSLPPR